MRKVTIEIHLLGDSNEFKSWDVITTVDGKVIGNAIAIDLKASVDDTVPKLKLLLLDMTVVDGICMSNSDDEAKIWNVLEEPCPLND